MRIAQIAPLYESVPPQLYGGTERVVSYLTEELVTCGHEVTLYASGDSQTRARLVAGCDRALRLQGKQIVDPIAHHLHALEQVFRDASRFDVLHFHWDYLHFLLVRRHRIPALTTIHGRLDLPDLGPLFTEFQDMQVVSISEAQRAPLAHAHWIGTVHHGLPADLYRFQPEPENYLAFLGRVSPEKRLDRAIEIALRAGLPLKVAAKVDKVDRAYFNAVIRPLLKHPLVEFVGEIGEHDKPGFLGQAKALLFPIDWPEPFGLVMIEAMACGTPVIAYPHGAVPEVLDPGVTGFIVRSQDEAVQAVANLERISRSQCRAVFEQRFSASRMAKDYLALYERLCGKSSSLGIPASPGLQPVA
ncbi:MAG: glycosyltransferase family 4 protein [Verrucomicrobia bacterium]|nr:glycosyltransferase family 4 protein [Verrucomicrobiota bacterium]